MRSRITFAPKGERAFNHSFVAWVLVANLFLIVRETPSLWTVADQDQGASPSLITRSRYHHGGLAVGHDSRAARVIVS